MSKAKKTDGRTANQRWLEQRVAWHLAALNFAYDKIVEVEERIDAPTKRIVMRRLIKMESLVDVIAPIGKHSPPRSHAAPFLHDDAAALILWPRRKAVKLARALGIDEQYVDIFNMDWFPFSLDA